MLHFIVNGGSGLGRGHKTIKKIMDYCFKEKIEYTVHITSRKGHATAIASELSLSHPDHTIVAVGGDGTFHETLNGIIDPSRTPLGFIPSGRGNDYARAALLPLDPIRALKSIIANNIVYSDYINVGDKRCLNVAGTGLDIDVLQRVEGKRGKISYLISLVHCIKHFSPYHLTVTANGKTTSYNACMVGVCNGIAIGGGLKISPLSNINDGKLNVVVFSMPEDGKLMKYLPKLSSGKHLSLPITTHYTCEQVTVESDNGKPVQLDGEIYENMILSCSVAPAALKTFKQI